MLPAAVQDFLVRQLMGFDSASGAMGVGGEARLGQRIRFMVRDCAGAKSDLMEHALILKRRQLQVGNPRRLQIMTDCCSTRMQTTSGG